MNGQRLNALAHYYDQTKFLYLKVATILKSYVVWSQSILNAPRAHTPQPEPIRLINFFADMH